MENSRFRSVFLDNYYLLKNKKYLTDIKHHLKNFCTKVPQHVDPLAIVLEVVIFLSFLVVRDARDTRRSGWVKSSTCVSGSLVEYSILKGNCSKSWQKVTASKLFSWRMNLKRGINLVVRTLRHAYGASWYILKYILDSNLVVTQLSD
jgi:hypothetical protein